MSNEFIREVDEDLRNQQLSDFWKKYGKFIIAAAVLIVLLVAGFQGLGKYRESLYLEQADKYAKALEQVKTFDNSGAVVTLNELTASGVEGFEILSAFKLAEIELGKGNTEAAVEVLDNFISTSDADKVYKELAGIQAALLTLDTASYDQISDRLAAMTANGNPWQFLAQELLALSALKNGNTEEAKRLMTDISQNLEAPENVKQRINQLMGVIE